MSFSPRFFIFFITLFLLVGIGLVAGTQINSRQPTYDSARYSQSVYDAIPVDVPKMLREEPYIIATTTATTTTATISEPAIVIVPPKPKNEITATAYLVGNLLTGKIYLQSDINKSYPVASMSKLITTIVATNIMSSTTMIEITPPETDVPPDGSELYAGEKFRLQELLRPLLLSSSNVAAEAIASSSDRSNFMGLMSNMAWKIGMPTAYFADPSGLDPHNKASAKDMFALARYLYSTRPDILSITRNSRVLIATTTDHGSHVVDSTHPFVDEPNFIGGKTGRTPIAGETMLTILRIKGQPIAFIVLHSDIGSREVDTRRLIKKYESL